MSSAGAEGISQFMPATWPSWDEPPAVAGPDSPFVPADAIMAQGRYDCALAQLVAPLAGGGAASLTDLLLAAYNAGPEAVLDAGGVPPIPQTEAYVAAIDADIPGYAEQLAGPDAGSGADLVWPSGSRRRRAVDRHTLRLGWRRLPRAVARGRYRGPNRRL